MARPDSLRRFVFEKEEVRGCIVRLDETWQRMLEADDYPAEIQTVLGEALAATALLGRNLKFDGHLTVQIQGGAHVRLLVLQCDNEMRLRGLARFGDQVPPDFAELVDGSVLCVTVESSRKGERYQSIVPLSESTLADCLGHYYEQSVQLPTMFMLAADNERAAGLMLQVMPERKGGNNRWADLLAQLEGLDVARVSQMDESLLLTALFPEDDIRLFDAEPVCFHCDCSMQRIESMLYLLGADELVTLPEGQQPVEVRCEFCNQAYMVSAERILAIAADLRSRGDEPLH